MTRLPLLGGALSLSAVRAGVASAAAKSRPVATESAAARSRLGVRSGRDRRLYSTISARMSGTDFTIAGIFIVATGPCPVTERRESGQVPDRAWPCATRRGMGAIPVQGRLLIGPQVTNLPHNGRCRIMG